jgi:hypothetical protein
VGAEGAGHGLGDAAADQGLDGDEQLHDRCHAASAGIYFARGDIDPFIAAPVAAGVLVGATAGSRLLGRLHSAVIRTAFVAVLVWVSAEMLLKGCREHRT